MSLSEEDVINANKIRSRICNSGDLEERVNIRRAMAIASFQSLSPETFASLLKSSDRLKAEEVARRIQSILKSRI